MQDSTLELYPCKGLPAPDVAPWGAHADQALMKIRSGATGGNFDAAH